MAASSLCLGTAQFGMNYGVANNSGKVELTEVESILAKASEKGIQTIDTAINYGESESVLGNFDLSKFNVISKIPGIPNSVDSVEFWIRKEIDASLKRLNINQYYALLLHVSDDLLKPFGPQVYRCLNTLKEQGLVSKVGVSVYNPEQLDNYFQRGFNFDIVQLPFNLLNDSFREKRWFDKLRFAGVEIHTRSVFSQGLLLLPTTRRPEKFSRYSEGVWDVWHSWLTKSGLKPTEACMRFVLGQMEIDKIVVGIDSLQQFEELIKIATIFDQNELDLEYPSFTDIDERLINPALWDQL